MMEAGAKETAADTSSQDNAVPDGLNPDVSQEVDGAALDVDLLEGSLFDLALPDVLLGDSGGSLQSCYDCSVEKCSNELSKCEGDAKCRTLVLCLFGEACFDATAQMGIDQACALGCFSKAGVSQTDPALALALSFAQCVNGECKDKCGLPDGGFPMDGGMPDGVSVPDGNVADAVPMDVTPQTDGGAAPDTAVD
jgi:hypothetical protein